MKPAAAVVAFACIIAARPTMAQSDAAAHRPSPTAWLEVGMGFATMVSRDPYASDVDLGARIGVGAHIARAFAVEASAIGSSPLESGPSGVNLIACIDPVTHQPTGCPRATPFQISGVAVAAVRMDDGAPGTRLSIGAGSYTLSHYVSNGSSTRALGIEAGVDVEIVAMRPALTVGVHPVFLPNVRGGHEWYLPLDLGVLLW